MTEESSSLSEQLKTFMQSPMADVRILDEINQGKYCFVKVEDILFLYTGEDFFGEFQIIKNGVCQTVTKDIWLNSLNEKLWVHHLKVK